MSKGESKTKSQLGLEDWPAASRMAENCTTFIPDVEEEQVADDPRSCYNCRYRRWLADAVACLAV